MDFRISALSAPENGVWRLYKARSRIYTDPPYQRLSDIWSKQKKQMLIDTILNGFDVPKMYFHRYPGGRNVDGVDYEYAIIDGKQRLEAIWAFIDGKFSLDSEFEFYRDSTVKAGGMTYAALAKNYPDLKTDFDSYTMSIISVEATDDEIIEDLFSRLNEAVPLSAAEKRNALGGPVPEAVRKLSASKFFTEKVPFSNSRYRHFNIATIFLLVAQRNKVVDTKKAYLDDYVMGWRKSNDGTLPKYEAFAGDVLSKMYAVFEDDDDLLKQAGMILLYYHMFRLALVEGWVGEIERHKLLEFEALRRANRAQAEDDIAEADYNLLEFDRYAQSPNDAYAVKLRLSTILEFVFDITRSIDEL